MAEQFPAVTLPVTPGMRDDIEPQAAPVGTITRARNVRFPRAGTVQSRWGQRAVSLTALGYPNPGYDEVLTAQGPDFIHPAPGGFVFGAQGFGYRWDIDAVRHVGGGSYSTAQPRGRLDVSAREELTAITADILTPWPLSTAVSGGIVATCHAVGNGQPAVFGGVVGTLQDGAAPGPVAGAVVRVFTHGGAAIGSSYGADAQSGMVLDDALGTLKFVYQNGTALLARTFTADGSPGAASAAIGTLATATSFYAACRWPGIGWAVVYQSAAGTLTIQKMAGLAVVGAPVVIAITPGPSTPVSIYADATNLFVGWALRGGASWDAQGRVCDAAFGGVSTFTVRALGSANAHLGPPLFGPSAVAGTVLALVGKAVTPTPTVGTMDTIAYQITTAGAVQPGAVNHMVLPLSAPFGNGLWWARHATYFGGSIQTARAMLLDFQEARAGAAVPSNTWLQYPKVALLGDQEAFPGDAGAPPAGVYLQHLHTPVQLSTGEWVMGIPRVVRFERMKPVSGGDGYLSLCEWLRFATNCEQQIKTVGFDVLASGSLTSLVGAWLFEATIADAALAAPSQGLDIGLFQPPSIATLTATASGAAGFMPLGTFQYRAVIELIDARGRRWRSAPSSVRKVTLTGVQNSVSLVLQAWLPLLRAFSLSPITSRLVVHVYRTSAGGFNFQRITPPLGAPVPHTAGTFTYLDVADDVVQAQREFLYTDGGVLQNDHPPSCRFLADTEDRVWLGGLWDPNLIQSSKTIVPGEGLAFSDLDAFKVDLKEPCTGLAAQDGILFAFTAARVYAIQGLGPNQQGQGAWDDAKRELSRSTGCIDWRSIVETTAGIFYQSERGIMLVPRGGGEPQFVGAAVQKLLTELGGTITGAAVCQQPDGLTVRFCCGAGTLVLDLVTLAWSYDIPPAAALHVKVCDTVQGVLLARRALSGTVGFDFEQYGLTTDQGAQIPSFVSWAPARPGGLAGWGFFVSAIGVMGKLDGLPYPATALTFSATVDNDASCTATRATMADFAAIDYRRLALRNRQGCAAALSFETAGAPWRFVGWTIETLPLDGPRRTPPAEYL